MTGESPNAVFEASALAFTAAQSEADAAACYLEALRRRLEESRTAHSAARQAVDAAAQALARGEDKAWKSATAVAAAAAENVRALEDVVARAVEADLAARDQLARAQTADAAIRCRSAALSELLPADEAVAEAIAHLAQLVQASRAARENVRAAFPSEYRQLFPSLELEWSYLLKITPPELREFFWPLFDDRTTLTAHPRINPVLRHDPSAMAAFAEFVMKPSVAVPEIKSAERVSDYDARRYRAFRPAPADTSR